VTSVRASLLCFWSVTHIRWGLRDLHDSMGLILYSVQVVKYCVLSNKSRKRTPEKVGTVLNTADGIPNEEILQHMSAQAVDISRSRMTGCTEYGEQLDVVDMQARGVGTQDGFSCQTALAVAQPGNQHLWGLLSCYYCNCMEPMTLGACVIHVSSCARAVR
jgi:hypothetical protein